MGSKPASGSRTYRSTLRRDQAELTRARIIRAAASLFLERGYGGTTVAAVAQTAGVSAETIYSTLAGKMGLLRQVIEDAIFATRGPLDEHGRFPQGSPFARIAAQPTARDRLATWVEVSVPLLETTSPLHAVLRGAADTDAQADELRAQLLRDRREAVQQVMSTCLGDDLRADVSVDQATERFLALMGPELHRVLTVDLGWPLEQYRAWVTAVLTHDLLDPKPSMDDAVTMNTGDAVGP